MAKQTVVIRTQSGMMLPFEVENKKIPGLIEVLNPVTHSVDMDLVDILPYIAEKKEEIHQLLIRPIDVEILSVGVINVQTNAPGSGLLVPGGPAPFGLRGKQN